MSVSSLLPITFKTMQHSKKTGPAKVTLSILSTYRRALGIDWSPNPLIGAFPLNIGLRQVADDGGKIPPQAQEEQLSGRGMKFMSAKGVSGTAPMIPPIREPTPLRTVLFGTDSRIELFACQGPCRHTAPCCQNPDGEIQHDQQRCTGLDNAQLERHQRRD